MGLVEIMIRVLTNNYHLHIVERAQVKGLENAFTRGVARTCSIFRTHKLYQLLEVGLLKLRRELCLPALFYLYVHIIYYNKV